MAKNKYYAVRKGLKTSIFENWNDCQAATAGYSNAEFKGFPTLEEAENYLNNGATPAMDKKVDTIDIEPTKVIVYVDGSFDEQLKKYSFGCVIVTPSGDIIKEHGNGNNPASENEKDFTSSCLQPESFRRYV